MGGYLMDIIGMKAFLEYIVVLFSPYGSLCLKPGSIAHLDMVQFSSYYCFYCNFKETKIGKE